MRRACGNTDIASLPGGDAGLLHTQMAERGNGRDEGKDGEDKDRKKGGGIHDGSKSDEQLECVVVMCMVVGLSVVLL